jgi:alginate O-acetyltransferase complex protein AlgI
MLIQTRYTGGRLIPHRRYAPAPDPGTIPGRSSGLYPGEPENCRRRLREFLPVMAQLGLMLALFDAYRIETRSFRIVVLLAVATLPLHYLAPYRWKKPLLVAISVVGMFLVNGMVVSTAVLAVSAVLLGLAAARIPWRARVGAIAAVAVALAVLANRSAEGALVISRGAIPVVATMFMFRMIVYLYELKHSQRREPFGDALCYFFLLPNYSFPHFPVVDYRALQRGYFVRGIHEIQRAGVLMMARGTAHLFLYRVVERMLFCPAATVHDALGLAGYVVCNYLLYLRVSGQFHLACGMLHLFGFQLAETHHHYLLASGFTDYWRRINIYWKDFMVRIVFNPVVFRLKHLPQQVALATATVAVFVTTWLLHAYQSYWLRGAWGFSAPDALFWGLLGVLVLINVQLEARAQRVRVLRPSPLALAVRAGRIAGTFTTIALLWSLWSSPSVEEWLALMRRGLRI